MPELPEVRVVCKSLNEKVQNLVFKKVEIFNPKLFKEYDPSYFQEFLIGEKILKISNLGKNIIYFLTNNKIMLSHLRMEGKYSFYEQKPKETLKHIQAIFYFENGSELHYRESRPFGTFHIRYLNNYLKIDPLAKVAQSPGEIDFETFYNRLSKKALAIKPTLLDQSIVSGIGNIYADEILFASKIHPATPSNLLSKDKVKEILKNAIEILDKSTELGGSTINSYESLNKKEGQYQNFLKVHTKKGEFCIKCSSKIEKIKFKGRGTYFCPTCQKQKDFI
ncbi:DNA-formamidopyrimidine glycosylase [Mycoplasmopsis pulmonis]|uniref:DNA-formamidopyrimidine glycosylase n=1 Tax=Mycoplasmopsis pulmonis TaxID=2107 RepID=UPI001004F8F6|nr:DNA-formamidopyrimidine glycosylase [Mycoplasmopsis pulmonis]MDZ7293270.1 DNA-formamidopyrimidine glycosylase [Mycoplasmopsis pulmonis]VEU68075.1 formamidopyrimidine-DNA glycosylase [Mycoplasmopsis pulmonis]